MNVTVIGAGNMGSAIVKQLARAGHQVKVTARNPEKAQAVAAAQKPAEPAADSGKHELNRSPEFFHDVFPPF